MLNMQAYGIRNAYNAVSFWKRVANPRGTLHRRVKDDVNILLF